MKILPTDELGGHGKSLWEILHTGFIRASPLGMRRSCACGLMGVHNMKAPSCIRKSVRSKCGASSTWWVYTAEPVALKWSRALTLASPGAGLTSNIPTRAGIQQEGSIKSGTQGWPIGRENQSRVLGGFVGWDPSLDLLGVCLLCRPTPDAPSHNTGWNEGTTHRFY